MRGDRRKQELEAKENDGMDNEIEIIGVSDYKPRKITPPEYWQCIKKIREVDPLEFLKYKAEMKIISFINERPVIQRIIEHLNLWDNSQKQRPPSFRTGGRKSLFGRSSNYFLENPNNTNYLTTVGLIIKSRILPLIDSLAWLNTPLYNTETRYLLQKNLRRNELHAHVENTLTHN